MKLLLALLTAALLGAGVSACGSATKSGGSGSVTTAAGSTPATSTSSSTSAGSGTTSTGYHVKADQDKDNDVGAPYDDKNNKSVLDYGKAASPADNGAVTALVKRYYAAAAAGNGAAACSMIVTSLAKAVPEDYGRDGGPPYLRGGKTCPAVMVLLFKYDRQQLATYLQTLNVRRVRLKHGSEGLAVLSFGKLPERELPVVREGKVWKVEALLDSELP